MLENLEKYKIILASNSPRRKDVRVMKGAVLPDNSIVGNSAIVTNKFDR